MKETTRNIYFSIRKRNLEQREEKKVSKINLINNKRLKIYLIIHRSILYMINI